MPQYYFQIDASGRILPLMDYPTERSVANVEEILALLRTKTELAVKLIVGTIGQGFYKAEYKDGTYFLNGTPYSTSEMCAKLASLRNYVFTEYFHPHPESARIGSQTANAIRVLLGRMDGRMVMLAGDIRFGTRASGYVDNYGAGGVSVYVDENGCFTQGNILDSQTGRNRVITHHPDNGEELKGRVPLWDDVREACRKLDRFFPQMDYLGVDFVVTDQNEVKILEINSLTSISIFQTEGSVLDTPQGAFFRERL